MTTVPSVEAAGGAATSPNPARPRIVWRLGLAGATWLAVAALVEHWPDAGGEATGFLAACAAIIGLTLLAATRFSLAPVGRAGPWLVVLACSWARGKW
jgi:hypothetical protein